MDPAADLKTPSRAFRNRMMAGYYERLAAAPTAGRKVVYTFVPGNLAELILAFDAIPVYPEILALQAGLRGDSGALIDAAETRGYADDCCSYVKCHIGTLPGGYLDPHGQPLPPPDLLLLSYTGCFTFMKWFENLQAIHGCPVVMLHVPYQADGAIAPEMVGYVVAQLRETLIPALERLTGRAYDPERLGSLCALAAETEDRFVACLESARHRPSPIDGFFGAVFDLQPVFGAFRCTREGIEYYRLRQAEIAARIAAGQGPATLEGPMAEERYRLVMEGTPDWAHFWSFWRLFHAQGAVVVAASYIRVGGLYEQGFRHDPQHPLESLARYCLGCYTNLSLPQRAALLADYARDYGADGIVVNSVKSCKSFSAGQLPLLREVERRTGLPGLFLETDLVDPRYFSRAQLGNRLDAFFQMIDARRRHGPGPGR